MLHNTVCVMLSLQLTVQYDTKYSKCSALNSVTCAMIDNKINVLTSLQVDLHYVK
jgi:hypothetical protein